MCGIAGWVGSIDADPPSTIRAMVDAIDHRGPDDRGWWEGDDAALGMTRLSIIDLAGGHQPKWAGPWCVVFNGEIYNFRALRDELVSLGHTFEGTGDSEVVAHATLQWGRRAFSRLDGMYSIAAFNTDTRELLLARDRYGEKPLYLLQDGPLIRFASEPKAFGAALRSLSLDQDSLTRYLALGFVPGPQGIWENLTTLSPGHHATVTGGRVTLHPTECCVGEPGGLEVADDPVESLDRRLRAAVSSRLVADVDVGVLLSGGIDSSLVAAHAAALHPGVQSFSVAIGDPARDESAHAAHVAEALGTTHHVMTVGNQEALEVVPELASVYDEPFADSSAIPTLLLSRFVAGQVKVALSGDGGDEFFSGYRRHGLAATPGRRIGPVGAAADLAAHAWWVRPQGPWLHLLARHAQPRQLYLDQVGGIDRRWLRAMGRDRAAMAPVDALVAGQGAAGSRWPEAADRRLYLPGDILTKIDRASMSCGLEVRAPFLAPVVAEWAASLPRSVVGPAGAKALPRALLRRYFGRDLADRPKQGFSVPMARWLRGPLNELVDLACDGHLATSGMVNRRTLLSLRRALDRRFDKAATPLWTVAAFELWHQRWQR